ncbi:uncharacterized protein LOC119397378 [Rhipicephalus sanguineus]|uniref:uncharacterized protein LOC119397378 n=1 Tax=Rhipicephalus sanguineus TaxID=34632 RepID=UPI001895CD90|nr:uncharacterized protein LOC119397378 [Rhipicephalus sanguineus]
MLNPKVLRYPVLAIAVGRGISEMDLAELIASSFVPAADAAPGAAVRAASYTAPPLPAPEPNLAADIRSLCEEDVTLFELERVLLRKRKRSAPGPDGVTHHLLRNLDASKRPILLEASDRVFASGSLPAQWRTATVVPVLNGWENNGGNALHRLHWIADACNVFAPKQCGFRQHRATADCLAAVVSTLEQALHDKEMAIHLLLDVQSAFDSLPHASIVGAVRSLGVEGRLLDYARAFVADRTFGGPAVRVGGLAATSRAFSSTVRASLGKRASDTSG